MEAVTRLHPTLGLRRASGTGSDPPRTSVETLGAPSPAPSSEELDPALQRRLRAPKNSSTRPHGLASTPPWKRLATSHPQPGSEEPDLELPTRSGAPKSTEASQRETAPRLRGNDLRPLAIDRAPKNPTSSCRRPQALRRTPSSIDARPRHASVETIYDFWLSIGLRRVRPRAADALRRSEEHHQTSARDRITSPWKRSTTPGPRLGSEEPSLELPARSGAPRITIACRRETASRLRERPPALSNQSPRPEGRTVRPMNAARPSWDPSTHRQRALLVRRPPRHTAGLLPSPRTFPQTPLHVHTPKGASVKEANTSRPCGPVNRHQTRQATPKGSPSDLQPASRSMELNSADLSSRHAAPKSDALILEFSHELRGSAHTKRCTASQTPKSPQATRDFKLARPERPPDRLGHASRPRRDARRVRGDRLVAPKALCRACGPPRSSEEPLGRAQPVLTPSFEPLGEHRAAHLNPRVQDRD